MFVDVHDELSAFAYQRKLAWMQTPEWTNEGCIRGPNFKYDELELQCPPPCGNQWLLDNEDVYQALVYTMDAPFLCSVTELRCPCGAHKLTPDYDGHYLWW